MCKTLEIKVWYGIPSVSAFFLSLTRSCSRGPFSSREADYVLNSVGREPALSILPVLQDEGNRLSEILLAFLNGLTLTICAWDLRAIPDVPLPITLDDRGELVVKCVL